MRRANEPIPKLAIPEAFAPSEPQLVGVSGGRDSIALLHWLHTHGFKKLIAVHLDHRLRAESGEDAVFVRKFADSLGVECIIGNADVAALAKKQRLSIETPHAEHATNSSPAPPSSARARASSSPITQMIRSRPSCTISSAARDRPGFAG